MHNHARPYIYNLPLYFSPPKNSVHTQQSLALFNFPLLLIPGKWIALLRLFFGPLIYLSSDISNISTPLKQVPDFRNFTLCFTSQSFVFQPRRCFCDASIFVCDVLHTTPFFMVDGSLPSHIFPRFVDKTSIFYPI